MYNIISLLGSNTRSAHYAIRYRLHLSGHSRTATRVCSCIFVKLLSLNSRVTQEVTVVYSMQALFHSLHEIHLRVLQNYCKNHVSNTLCAARHSVFLCAARKLTTIAYQRRIKAYDEMAR